MKASLIFTSCTLLFSGFAAAVIPHAPVVSIRRDMTASELDKRQNNPLSPLVNHDYTGYCVAVSKLLIKGSDQKITEKFTTVNGHTVRIDLDFFASTTRTLIDSALNQWLTNAAIAIPGSNGKGVAEMSWIAIGETAAKGSKIAIGIAVEIIGYPLKHKRSEADSDGLDERGLVEFDFIAPDRNLQTGNGTSIKALLPRQLTVDKTKSYWDSCQAQENNSAFGYHNDKTCTATDQTPWGCSGCCCGNVACGAGTSPGLGCAAGGFYCRWGDA